jgi:hypothetical protein
MYPLYRHTEVDVIHPHNGSILEASVSLGLTPSDLENELIKAGFINRSEHGWLFVVHDGTALQRDLAIGDQNVGLGSTVYVVAT